MTKAVKDLVEMSWRLDSMKKFNGHVKDELCEEIFADENFSAFPLYYVANKYVGDVTDLNVESINKIFAGWPVTRDKLKALVTTLTSEACFVNPMAFAAAVEAIVNKPIDPKTLDPLKSYDIAFGMTIMSGIQGAVAMPFGSEVVKYISAALKYDGFRAPPLYLMMHNITLEFDESKEQEDYIRDINDRCGKLSLKQLRDMEHFSQYGASRDAGLQNYLAFSQDGAIRILEMYDKTLDDWNYAITGA